MKGIGQISWLALIDGGGRRGLCPCCRCALHRFFLSCSFIVFSLRVRDPSFFPRGLVYRRQTRARVCGCCGCWWLVDVSSLLCRVRHVCLLAEYYGSACGSTRVCVFGFPFPVVPWRLCYSPPLPPQFRSVHLYSLRVVCLRAPLSLVPSPFRLLVLLLCLLPRAYPDPCIIACFAALSRSAHLHDSAPLHTNLSRLTSGCTDVLG